MAKNQGKRVMSILGMFIRIILFALSHFHAIKFSNCHSMTEDTLHVEREKKTCHFILMTSHLKLFIIRNFTRNKEEKNSLEIE